MCFTEGCTSYTSFIGLTTLNKIAHASCQLIIALNQVTDIRDHKTAVGASHIHLPIHVYCHRAWQCCDDLMGVLVLKICALTFLSHDPLIIRVGSII